MQSGLLPLTPRAGWPTCWWDFDVLVQERRNSSALAMELRISCTDPSILLVLERKSGPHLNIKTVFSRYKDEKVMGLSYLYNGYPYFRKTASLYWDGPWDFFSFFCEVPSTIIQHWFRSWLANEQVTSHYPKQWRRFQTPYSITRPQSIKLQHKNACFKQL